MIHTKRSLIHLALAAALFAGSSLFAADMTRHAAPQTDTEKNAVAPSPAATETVNGVGADPDPENTVASEPDTPHVAITEKNPFTLPAKPKKKELDALFEIAQSLVREGDWREAHLALSALQDSKPAGKLKDKVKLLSAYADLELGNDEKAVPNLLTACSTFPKIESGLRRLAADALIRMKKPAEALAQYRKLSVPTKSDFDKALEQEQSERFDWRLEELSALIQLEKFDEAIRLSRSEADSYAKENNDEQHPRLIDLLWLRSVAHRGKGNAAGERTTLQSLVGMYPPTTPCRYCPSMKTRLAELATDGIFLEPTYGKNLLDYARRLRLAQRYEDQLERIMLAQRAFPPGSVGFNAELNTALNLEKAKSLNALGRYEEALPLFHELLSQTPENAAEKEYLHYTVAKTLGRLNRLEDASAAYLKLAELFPNGPHSDEARFMAGWLLAHGPTFSLKADELLGEAQKKSRRRDFAVKSQWFRAWFAYRTGNDATARVRLEELLKRYPKSGYTASARYWLARLLERGGQKDEAHHALESMAEQDAFPFYRLVSQSKLNGQCAQIAEPNPQDDASSSGFSGILENSKAVNKEIALALSPKAPERAKRLETNVALLEPVFPELRAGLTWMELGVSREGGFLLSRFVNHLLTAKQKNKSYAYPGESKEAVKLRIKRREVLAKLPANFYTDLSAQLLEWNDPATAFRLFTRLLSKEDKIKLPKEVRLKVQYPVAFPTLVKRYAAQYKLPPELLLAVMRTESTFNPQALSPARAMGLMQIIPATAQKIAAAMGEDTSHSHAIDDPDVNVRYGAWYLSKLIEKFHGQLPLAIAAYNGGPHNVQSWLNRAEDLPWDEFIESIEFVETRNYVKKVLRAQAMYHYLYGGTFRSWDFSCPINKNSEGGINF